MTVLILCKKSVKTSQFSNQAIKSSPKYLPVRYNKQITISLLSYLLSCTFLINNTKTTFLFPTKCTSHYVSVNIHIYVTKSTQENCKKTRGYKHGDNSFYTLFISTKFSCKICSHQFIKNLLRKTFTSIQAHCQTQ